MYSDYKRLSFLCYKIDKQIVKCKALDNKNGKILCKNLDHSFSFYALLILKG